MDSGEPRLIPPEVWERIAFHARAERVFRLLEEYVGERVRLSRAAREAGMQTNAFSRFFSQQIGMTFSEFQTAYRVTTAMNLMVTSDAALKEIASAVGFESITTFERQFKKWVGMSPSEYRAELLKKKRLLITDSNPRSSSFSQS